MFMWDCVLAKNQIHLSILFFKKMRQKFFVLVITALINLNRSSYEGIIHSFSYGCQWRTTSSFSWRTWLHTTVFRFIIKYFRDEFWFSERKCHHSSKQRSSQREILSQYRRRCFDRISPTMNFWLPPVKKVLLMLTSTFLCVEMNLLIYLICISLTI